MMSALAHGVVFGLVEGVASEIADGAQRPALVGAHHALGRILHHHQAVPAGKVHDGVHLAGHTRIVHHHDHLGALGDGRLDLGLINVHGVRAHIHKH